MNRSAIARGAGSVLFVAAVALAGLWAGRELGERRRPAHAQVETDLVAGAPFPSGTVVAADGSTVDTAELTRGGAIVLFMRFDCPACGLTVDRWRDEVAAGALAGVPVVGITADPREEIPVYREAKRVPFPVYADPDGTFAREHGVTSVPFVVVVGPGGTIRELAVGFRSDTDFERLRALTGGT